MNWIVKPGAGRGHRSRGGERGGLGDNSSCLQAREDPGSYTHPAHQLSGPVRV